MECKGTAVTALVDYVRSTQGEEGVRRLLERLPDDSRALLADKILPSGWYPFVPAFVTPTRVVCELFHGGDVSGAWQVGRYSADSALKGVYKALLVFVSPKTVVERGPGVLAAYYRPLETRVTKLAEGRYGLHLSGMDEPSPIFDRRIAGWTERALEMAGAKDIEIDLVSSASDGAPATEIHFVWK